MSETNASYSFLPWLRRGLAAHIVRVDGAGPAGPRAAVPAELQTSGGSAQVGLALQGPGEIEGFDGRVVARTWPVAGANSAEANYFPIIEFAQADLPWRYTPAAADGERLRPWLCLAVLDGDVTVVPPDDRHPLPRVSVDAADLPRLDQSWAWAHTQVSGADNADAATVAQLLRTSPSRVLSRLVAPRKLAPHTAYRAVVVPTFERGRLAGLRQPVPDPVDALAPAWGRNGAVELPVYYSWEFHTGEPGDFEKLVRLLKARVLPSDLGRRPMAVDQPGGGLPSANANPLGMEGALRSPAMESTPWPDGHRVPFVTALAALVSRPRAVVGETEERLVVPPLYGGAVIRRDALEPGQRPPWFQTLNADPRNRAGAGLGSSVVRAQQRALMAAAWLQVDGIRKLNEALRRAQAASAMSDRVFQRHLATATAPSLLRMTAPLHARVKASPTTVAAVLEESPIADGALDAQFRRVTRRRGPAGRRAAAVRRRMGTAGVGDGDDGGDNLLRRMNAGEVQPASVPPRPAAAVTPEDLAGSGPATTAALGCLTPARLARLPRGLLLLGAGVALVLAWLLRASRLGRLARLVFLAFLAAAGAPSLAGLFGDERRREAWRDGTLGPDDVMTAPTHPDFRIVELPDGDPGEPDRVPNGPSWFERLRPRTDSQDAAVFRQATADYLDEVTAPVEPGERRVEVDLEGLRTTLLDGLEPKATIGAAVKARVHLPPSMVGTVILPDDDPVEEVMAAPQFDQPMYEPLRDLSQDWVLPGLERIPPNTVSLLSTNQRFVESYMVGLNHAMAEELLWNEYPTDRRGTYFRQFWDAKGYVPEPGRTFDPESLKDLKPIHRFRSRDELGANSSRRPPPGGEHLVLLIRGELLKRYPNTIVYAAKTVLDGDGKRAIGHEEKHPVFPGKLHPDISFFGFELSPAQAKGNTAPTADQGWWFVLQEQPSEPRFGLDDGGPPFGGQVTTWNTLSWANLVGDAAALDQLTYIDLAAALPNTNVPGSAKWHPTEGTTSAQLAFITLQQPVRIAIHASDMLPAQTT